MFSHKAKEQPRLLNLLNHNGSRLWTLWRGSLLPLGCEAAPIPSTVLHQAQPGCRIYGGFATEREQAPSPQLRSGL
ncbi:hypothetical protein FHG55_25750 [Pseudomonas jessenii]|uniref:Uncharacterized protein n=1 Tax=Pseudomonas jessenii TaxID=77298 RepID=A0A5C4KQH7_PSEJE|nr:hypothetical protein FHG55_25750 [Pseudomonas jessenii]